LFVYFCWRWYRAAIRFATNTRLMKKNSPCFIRKIKQSIPAFWWPSLTVLLLLSACQKKGIDKPASAAEKHNGKVILRELEADPYVSEYFYFMDLGSATNSEKRYFKAKVKDVVSDAFEIIGGPFPIDSLANNWPANIQSGSSGLWLTDFIFLDSVRVQLTGPGAGRRTVSTKKSLLFRPAFVQQAGNGQQVNAYAYIKIPNATGGYLKKEILFFFKKGICVVPSQNNGTRNEDPPQFIDNITNVIPGTSAYDWKTVDNVVSYHSGGTNYTHLFIDYTNWRYFKIKETCSIGAAGNCSNAAIELSPYQSLDKLMQWPTAWR